MSAAPQLDRDPSNELADILNRCRDTDRLPAAVTEWDATVPDGWELATAYRDNDAQFWTPLGDLLADTEPDFARQGRLWAELAEAGRGLDSAVGAQNGDPVSLRWVTRLSNYRWAIAALPEDPRALALSAGADPRTPGWGRLQFRDHPPAGRELTPDEHLFLIELLDRLELDLHRQLFPTESDYFADRALAQSPFPDHDTDAEPDPNIGPVIA